MAAASWSWGAPSEGTSADTGLLAYFRSGLSGYVPLRSSARSNEEEAYLSLSHWERFLGFLACLAGSGLCFLFAFIFASPPILVVRPHKFALAFTLGSLLFMAGFAVLTGPIAHLQHLLSPERRPFSVAYLASMALTLYFALGPKSRLPTVLCALVQIGCLLTYLANYFPGGTWSALTQASRRYGTRAHFLREAAQACYLSRTSVAATLASSGAAQPGGQPAAP